MRLKLNLHFLNGPWLVKCGNEEKSATSVLSAALIHFILSFGIYDNNLRAEFS